MKLLLIAFAKPLFGLVAGAGFWTVGVAQERAVQAQGAQLRALEIQELRVEELNKEARKALPDARLDDGPEPEVEAGDADKIQPDE